MGLLLLVPLSARRMGNHSLRGFWLTWRCSAQRWAPLAFGSPWQLVMETEPFSLRRVRGDSRWRPHRQHPSEAQVTAVRQGTGLRAAGSAWGAVRA